jgi:dipeptidyl aminopeptidase/acylaminoacyl peptidase
VRRLAALFALALVASGGLRPPLAGAQPLQTVAEKSDYKATSRYADVVAFCEAVAKRGPVAKLDYFGTSHEGRKLPLLVISDPPVATPQEAKDAGKLVVMAFANIHAGEVDGKEALLALARDLTDKKGHPLLKDLVILLVPILNADGNEKIDPKNRPRENGPADGAGTRENAQGLDLNRDFVKLESPEVRALVKLFNTWDPALVIDCHTTNGSRHRYTLTYDGPRYPAHDTELAEWANKSLFPDVTKKVKAATGFDIAPYGNFNRDRTRWESYPAGPRYGIQYVALRGKLGVLSESYSYAPFKERVAVSKAFVTACFEVAAARRKELAGVVAAPRPKLAPLRTATDAFPTKISVLGFEEVEKDGKRVVTDKPKDYSLHFVARVVPTVLTEVPFAYLVPAQYQNAIETLQRHGVRVEELREDIDLDVEAFGVAAVDSRETGFPKRFSATEVDGKWRSGVRRVPAGTIVVKTDQLSLLPVYLLEPRSEDGLLTWGFFKDGLKAGADFPVLRLARSYPLTLGAAPPLPENRVVNQPITEALLYSPTGGFTFGLQGTPVTPGAWLDADHFLQTKEGKLWKADARTGKAELFADPELIKKSLTAVKELDLKTAERISSGTFFRMNPARTAFLFDIGPDVGIAYFDGRPAVRLTKSDGGKEFVTFSPDGKRIAFVRNGNLFALDTEKPEEKQLTFDGGGDILNAKADWVYEEEIFNRNGRAFWWSPDGRQIAFMRFDDAPVRRFNIVNLSGTRGALETYPYPKVGDPNPLVMIGVASVGGGRPAFLDFGDYPINGIVISRVGWMPGSKAVFAYVQDRTQTWLDFVVWDTPDAKPRKLFRETTKAWVEDLGEPRFLPDGTFLIVSERSGWKHLYHYTADGRLIAQITDGEFEVRDVLRVDASEKQIYFTATMTSPTGLDLCRVKFGEKVEMLTEKGKSHRVSLAPSGPLFIDRYSDPKTPTRVGVFEIGKGEVRKLDTNPVRERDQFKFGRYERVKIPMKDGFELEGAITYPPDFDKEKKYPVWLFTYAGPHAPTIRDEWGGGRILDNSLATSGIIVFRVDPRSASGKGAQSAWTCYKQLGVQELKDLEEAVAWLGKNPYVDLTRVGISGHSYGGFMAAFALTHSKTFSAGIASAPVTDWKLYDTIYTERYMLTPKENPEGYAKTSCVAAAKNLHGKLLIIHGMIDDNVHMQNSVQLVDALQRAGKEFEMMIYPQSRHGIGGQHYMRLQTEFIRRTMGVQKKD